MDRRPGAAARLKNYAGNSPLCWPSTPPSTEAMIDRHARLNLGHALPNPWVDVDHLCAVTHEQVRARALDDWMAHFGIRCAVRHQAAADTLVECDLLQRIWPRVAAQCSSWADVQRLAAQHRWLPRHPDTAALEGLSSGLLDA
ncbi:MAG: hypothetical protein U5N23_03660 [Acidovorax sp.]|nr:hypothetical protein [Acidovorax sp.]MDZ7861895.1 hypothetical protein [Acidovorax sp.]